ncbi:hypothetical protein N434_04906 [Rhizobium sp. UGM030330-04]|nr:hypothetical protein N434_04906 [Rhizobium sp. UGM030330-04]
MEPTRNPTPKNSAASSIAPKIQKIGLAWSNGEAMKTKLKRGLLLGFLMTVALSGCEQNEWGCEPWEFEYLEGEEAREALRLYGNVKP